MNGKQRFIMQGEIYLCDLDDNIDSEQGGVRPCLVISIDILNKTSKNVIILPITKQNKKELPTHIKLTKKKYDFFECANSTILGECIRCISKSRVGKYIGRIDEEDLKNILIAKEYAYIEK